MRGRFLLWSLFPLVILVLLLAIFWNWDWFIPFVNSEASATIGREVKVQHLGVRFGRTIIVTAGGIAIDNPKDFPADAPPLANIDQLRVGVAVMDYLRHRTLSLTRITIDHPVIAVRELADGRNNYTLHIAQQNAPSHPPKIGHLIINNGTGSVILPSYKANFDLTVQTRPAPADDKLFVEDALYRYVVAMEVAVCAFWRGHHDDAIRLNEVVLTRGDLPPDIRQRVIENRQFSLDALHGAAASAIRK